MPTDFSDPDALRAAALSVVPGAALFAVDRDLNLLIADGQGLTDAGLDPRELIGRPLRDVVPGETFARLEPEYRAALAGETRSFEFASSTSDRWHLVHIGPLRDGGGAIVGATAISQDATPRRRVEIQRDEARTHFETAFSAAPIGMALVGLDGRFLRANQALCDLLGYSAEQITSVSFQQITHPDDLEADLGRVDQLLGGQIDDYTMEKRYYTASGHLIWALLAVALVRDDSGAPDHFISQIEDISDRKRMMDQLREMAEHDPVTDLFNRRRFEEELERQVGRCRRYGEQASLMVVDVDDFKAINDRFGHKLGDAALRSLARTLRQRLRSEDVVARIGGDEFAAVLPGATPATATAIAEELLAAVRDTPVTLGGDRTSMTVSIGVRGLDRHTGGDQQAFVAADKAMYRAKAAGRDMVVADA